MARGATKQNRQASAAKTAAAKRKPSRGARRQSRHVYEQSMFFPMLRRRAKWVFLFLAFAFVIGFVVFGVGTGSGFGGLGDLISGSNNPNGGPSTSALEKKVAENPKDAAAWHQLAVNYETSGDTSKAIDALSHYTALKPKSIGGLRELATQYQGKANRLSTQIQAAQNLAGSVTPSPYFQPSPTSPGTKKHPGQPIFSSPVIDSTVSTFYNTRLQRLQSEQRTDFSAAETTYHKMAALQPRNSDVQLALAAVAQQASDFPTSIAALKRYLQLEPSSAQAPLVRKQLKLLQGASKPVPVKTKPKHSKR